jgi:DNA-binding transcriptional LysR family regulator
MTQRTDFDTIEIHLIRVLKTLITERSVSRAAMQLRSSQPAVSAQLRRLRALTGDPVLVRAGNSMVPTETALQLLDPATRLLQDADRLFSPQRRAREFEASASAVTFRIAASDYLDPLFLPGLVTRLQRLAPQARIELLPLSGALDVRRVLAAGEADLVIGNWLQPPEELHLGRLLTDEVVCLVARDHPAAGEGAARARAWTAARYLACQHVAPMPLHAGPAGAAPGVIDEHHATLGLSRDIVVRSAHFGLIPQMLAGSLLVLTSGRQFCSRYVDNLPLRIVRCPVPFPPLSYYQLWHERTHASPSGRWLREQVREVARGLAGPAALRRRTVA